MESLAFSYKNPAILCFHWQEFGSIWSKTNQGLDGCSRETLTHIYKDVHSETVKDWKQPKCLLAEEYIINYAIVIK